LLVVLLSLLASCKWFKKSGSEAEIGAIARVGDEYLYADEVKANLKGLSGKDSIEALNTYAENWVKKQLLLKKAQDNIPEDDLGITKQVEDYRRELVLYEYEKALITQKLDTNISEQELKGYYEKYRTNFLLESDVYLVYYIKFGKDAPDLPSVRKWIANPKGEEDLQRLEGYCKEYALSYSIAQGVWYKKENLIKSFPVLEGAALPVSQNFKEYKTDMDEPFFIKIADAMKEGDVGPYDFVKDKIVKVLVEKRKMSLIEKAYTRIYQEGVKSGEFEVYIKK
jgi:hypothetical protein